MAVRLTLIRPAVIADNPSSISFAMTPAVGTLKCILVWTRSITASIGEQNGWTKEFTLVHNVSGGGRLELHWRKTEAGDGGNPTITFSGAAAGATAIAIAFGLDDYDEQIPFGSLSSGKSDSSQNIGPIQVLDSSSQVGGACLIIGAKSDDWTTASPLRTDAGMTYTELCAVSTTVGNDGALFAYLGTWDQPLASPGPSPQTITLTGGTAAPTLYFGINIRPAKVLTGYTNLAGQRATVSGTGTKNVVKTGTGTLTGRSASLAAVAKRTIVQKTPIAAIAAQRATVVGTGKRTITKTSSTALTAQRATVSASQAGVFFEAWAVGSPVFISARDATVQVSALAFAIIEDIGTEAEIPGRDAGVATSALKSFFSTSANLVAQNSFCNVLVGIERIGTGTIAAASATAAGVGSRGGTAQPVVLVAGSATTASAGGKEHTASGILLGSPAALATVEAVERRGTGILIARSPTMTVVGGGHAPGQVNGTGLLLGRPAVVIATTILERNATGALRAQPSSVVAITSRTIHLTISLLAGNATVETEVSFAIDDTWESDDIPWGQPSVIHARHWPVFVQDKSFLQAEITNKFDKAPVHVILERSGLTILGRDRQGNWKNEPGIVKFVTGIWPLLRGTPGSIVKVYVGGQMTTEEPIRWEGPYQAIIGETEFLDFTVSGRYISLRFESDEIQPPWELVSYDLELTAVGSR